jgi:hypothetical protein
VQFIGVPPEADQPNRRRKTAGLIEKGTLKKRITNIEQGITNIEVRYSIIIIFKKRLSAAIPYFIIRDFLFDILRFAVPTMCSFMKGFGTFEPDTRHPTPDT